MSTEARQRIEELQRDRKAGLIRNGIVVASCSAAMVMALVLWFVVSQIKSETSVVVEEAQQTLKTTCDFAQGEKLPMNIRENCEAAQRNELPQQLQSVVDNPDPNDPENQDAENQEAEQQESEQQDPESQEPEIQDPESQEPESPDEETNDPDPDDPETQEGEIQDPEINDPDPNDPDPADDCPAGWTQQEFHWYGRDGINNTGDEQDWLICVRNA